MTSKLTTPRREALLNVAEGKVYRRTSDGRTQKKATWMLDGSWQPPSQMPYNWLYEESYVELLASSRRAQLSPKGKQLFDHLNGQATLGEDND